MQVARSERGEVMACRLMAATPEPIGPPASRLIPPPHCFVCLVFV